MIAEAAVQEDVDFVGLSILSGAHMTMFPRVIELLKEKGAGSIKVFGGGIIPKEDVERLEEIGVTRIFGPGTDTRNIVEFIRETAAAS
jgi:methylmalonyl-CoA mutase C-terminal domain/subunit